MTMTRRTAILRGLGLQVGIATLPVWPASVKDFWNEKKPADWTSDEIQQMLTKSPWAKEAGVTYNTGPGGVGRPGGMGGYGGSRRGGRTQGGTVGAPGGPGPAPGLGKYTAIVRWESALPIREASHNQSKDDPLANYILSATGDLPMLGAHRDEDATQSEQRAEMLKQYTKLERRNGAIYLSTVKFPSSDSTLFYFMRTDPIFAEDKQVTFTTKLGPIEVKTRFTLKDMLYQGKLAL